MSAPPNVAEILLKLKAVTLRPSQPFTWASGLKAPIYCDNRLIISTVAERRAVIDEFVSKIRALQWPINLVAGTATAGIPHAAWIAEAMDLPMVYIRANEKKHGKKNAVEGRLPENPRAVLVEDLISTGGSVIKAARVLADQGAYVAGVIAIFQYGLDGTVTHFEREKLPFTTLTSLNELVATAVKEGLLSQAETDLISEWQKNPAQWSAQRQ